MKTHTRIYGSDEEADAHLERARYQFMHMMQGGNAVAHKQRERKQEDTRALVWRDSSKLVLDAPADYEPYFKQAGPYPQVKLSYPYSSVNEVFLLAAPRKELRNGLPLPRDSHRYDPLDDLMTTIRLVCTHLLAGHEQVATLDIVRRLVHAYDHKNQNEFLSVIRDYNLIVQKEREYAVWQQAKRGRKKRTPSELVEWLMHQVYSRVVSDHAEKLRKYEAFSNNVYGEMNASFVSNIVREADIRRDSVFIDLGSGIGNVVLQVAALCGCACWGIEQMATPAQLALKQLEEFKTRAKCYRISTGPVTFIQGNFLEEKRVAELMKRATHVLCNNYAFSAELNQDLLQLFLDLPDGARIVSLKSFIAPDRRITKRTASSVENILSVKEHVYERGSVSWTATSGAWFIHTVDRQAVKQFWATMDDA